MYAGKTLRTWLVSLPENCDTIGERGCISIFRWSLGGGGLDRERMLELLQHYESANFTQPFQHI